MTQAVTMLLATFQRTADTLRAAPTPMIDPVIVCVVETGMPSQVAAKSVIAPPVSAQHPCIGVKPGYLGSHCMHDAPAAEQRPQPHGSLAGYDDPKRHVEFAAELTLREQQNGNDAHGFLRVVATMAERIERSGDELQGAKSAVHRRAETHAQTATTR